MKQTLRYRCARMPEAREPIQFVVQSTRDLDTRGDSVILTVKMKCGQLMELLFTRGRTIYLLPSGKGRRVLVGVQAEMI